MSFGPRKPSGPPRSTRPGVVKKPATKPPATRTEAPKPQPAVKPRKPTAPTSTSKPIPKPIPVAPKPSAPKPPTPDPVYDYESDFESDESVPGAGSSSSESSAEQSASNNSSSEGGDDEDEDEADEVTPAVVPVAPNEVPKPRQNVTPRNARSVDILNKISLNDIAMDLYKFDPEEYAELRTTFGITSVVAYEKHIQTDCSSVSTASQTSGISVRTRSTCMHGNVLSTLKNEEDGHVPVDDDEDEGVQNYSSLQNIERMFTTLNGALERRFSLASTVRSGKSPLNVITPTGRGNRTQHRSILQLVRKFAPTIEALLESRRFRSQSSLAREMSPRRQSGDRPAEVVRSFDAGKMCPEFEVKLLQPNQADQREGTSKFVLEFWARRTYSRPMYRFGSWSPIVCVDYESRRNMMVFGGTCDGTLQMWLGDAGRCHNEVLAPHQIVAPSVKQRHRLNCWQMVAVKVLPVPMMRDSGIDSGIENAFNQVFGLYSTGIVIVWHVQIEKHSNVPTGGALSATLGTSEVSLVQSKVIDLNGRIGGRMPYYALRSFENLLLHDHHQMVLSSHHTVIRLSHFVQSEFDPVLLLQPDKSHTIMNLKRMSHANDTLFVLYSNKTVRVLKLNSEPDGGTKGRDRLGKRDDHPNLMLSVCTNKSCTIQSIVHDEAKRYGNPNGAGEGRADGGVLAPKALDVEKKDDDSVPRPRFHHGQQILFFDAQNPESILKQAQFSGSDTVSYRS